MRWILIKWLTFRSFESIMSFYAFFVCYFVMYCRGEAMGFPRKLFCHVLIMKTAWIEQHQHKQSNVMLWCSIGSVWVKSKCCFMTNIIKANEDPNPKENNKANLSNRMKSLATKIKLFLALLIPETKKDLISSLNLKVCETQGNPEC